MSPGNVAGGPTLVILLLLLSPLLLLGQNASSPGYSPTSDAPPEAPQPSASLSAIYEMTSSSHRSQDTAANPDRAFTPWPAVTAVSAAAAPPATASAPTRRATAAAETGSLPPGSTAVTPDVVANTVSATLFPSEPPASAFTISFTEGPGSLGTATPTPDPVAKVHTEASTPLPLATEKSFTTSYATEADTVNTTPMSEGASASSRSTTEPTSTASSLTSGTSLPITTQAMATHASTQLAPLTTPDATSQSVPKADSRLWAVMVVLLAMVVFVGGLLCFLFVRRRRRSGSQSFSPGLWGSQKSKRKGRPEDDAWAGPVMAYGPEGREECDGGEVGRGAEEKEGEGDELVLSTFVNDDEGQGPNGGVGRKGSKEVKKWEEEAPLLYIDEGAGEENQTPKGTEKSDAKGERERNGGVKESGEVKREEGGELGPAEELNGGTTFCLITAV